MKALIRYAGMAGLYPAIVSTMAAEHQNYYAAQTFPYGHFFGDQDLHELGRSRTDTWWEPPANEATVWRTSKDNILAAWVDGPDLIVRVEGRRHGIPWWAVRDAGLVVESGIVEEMDSFAPSSPPWESDVRPERPIPSR